MLELTRTRLSKDETTMRDEEGRGHEDGQNHPKTRRNRRRPTKPFIGNPEERTEDRSELSKGPKEKQEVGQTTQRIREETEVTDETVHRKPRR